MRPAILSYQNRINQVCDEVDNICNSVGYRSSIDARWSVQGTLEVLLSDAAVCCRKLLSFPEFSPVLQAPIRARQIPSDLSDDSTKVPVHNLEHMMISVAYDRGAYPIADQDFAPFLHALVHCRFFQISYRKDHKGIYGATFGPMPRAGSKKPDPTADYRAYEVRFDDLVNRMRQVSGFRQWDVLQRYYLDEKPDHMLSYYRALPLIENYGFTAAVWPDGLPSGSNLTNHLATSEQYDVPNQDELFRLIFDWHGSSASLTYLLRIGSGPYHGYYVADGNHHLSRFIDIEDRNTGGPKIKDGPTDMLIVGMKDMDNLGASQKPFPAIR